MKILGSDKKVIYITNRVLTSLISYIHAHKITDEIIDDCINAPYYYSTVNSYIDINPDRTRKRLTELQVKDIKPSVLYFDRFSKFPRTKLTYNDKFSRCIKENKCNYVVIGDECLDAYMNQNVYRTVKSEVLIATDPKTNIVVIKSATLDYEKEFKTTAKVTIEQFLKLNISEIDYVRRNVITFDDRKLDTIHRLLLEYTHPYILDKDLDAIISKSCESLTYDDVESLNAMLGSSDPEIVGTGLKCLCNYNVHEFPLTTSILLAINWAKTIKSCSIINTTEIKNLFNVLKFNTSVSHQFPSCIYSIDTKAFEIQDKDLEFSDKLTSKYFQNITDDNVEKFKAQAAKYKITLPDDLF